MREVPNANPASRTKDVNVGVYNLLLNLSNRPGDLADTKTIVSLLSCTGHRICGFFSLDRNLISIIGQHVNLCSRSRYQSMFLPD